jgi:SAM-dependent methyltransferase
MSLLEGFTSPYSALEARIYDALIAPAVLEVFREVGPAYAAPDSPAPGARLLDVGCGGGHVLLEIAARRPDLALAGVDLEPGQIARARRRAHGRGARVDLRVGDALALPFADGAFEAVISVASIKHWPDRRRGLAECARVLAPGGALVVVEADRGCRLEDARRFVARWRHLPAPASRVALALFRTFVAGQSLDLDEARELAAGAPGLDEVRVERVAGQPALSIRARRRREAGRA